MIVARALNDNGSALNVCPLITIDRLGVDRSSIRENGMMVRAFDGSKSIVVGEVDFTLETGSCQFVVPFVVVDISTTFNMLLGRPWVHTVGVIPSSQHQKVKFIKGDKIITIMAEKEILIHSSSAIPFIDTHEIRGDN